MRKLSITFESFATINIYQKISVGFIQKSEIFGRKVRIYWFDKNSIQVFPPKISQKLVVFITPTQISAKVLTCEK